MQSSYTSKEYPIHPFLIAPLPDFQDTLLIGPEYLTSHEGEFINLIYNDSKINYPYSKILNYSRSQICFFVTFHSVNAQEIRSGRHGLSATIGAIINKRIFTRHKPLIHLYKLYINLIEKIFLFNLHKEEPIEFLMNLQDKNNFDNLKQKIELLQTHLLYSNIPIFSSRKFIFKDRTSLFSFKKKDRMPQAILYEKIDNKKIDIQIEIFLSFFDEWLFSNYDLLNSVSSQQDSNANRDYIETLGCLYFDDDFRHKLNLSENFFGEKYLILK